MLNDFNLVFCIEILHFRCFLMHSRHFICRKLTINAALPLLDLIFERYYKERTCMRSIPSELLEGLENENTKRLR